MVGSRRRARRSLFERKLKARVNSKMIHYLMEFRDMGEEQIQNFVDPSGDYSGELFVRYSMALLNAESLLQTMNTFRFMLTISAFVSGMLLMGVLLGHAKLLMIALLGLSLIALFYFGVRYYGYLGKFQREARSEVKDYVDAAGLVCALERKGIMLDSCVLTPELRADVKNTMVDVLTYA